MAEKKAINVNQSWQRLYKNLRFRNVIEWFIVPMLFHRQISFTQIVENSTSDMMGITNDANKSFQFIRIVSLMINPLHKLRLRQDNPRRQIQPLLT